MDRLFYVYKRKNGFYYAELLDASGLRTASKSTRKRNYNEAVLTVGEWLKSGIPTGRKRRPRPAEIATGLNTILKSIKKTELNGDDAISIVSALKQRGLIDVPVVKSGPVRCCLPII